MNNPDWYQEIREQEKLEAILCGRKWSSIRRMVENEVGYIAGDEKNNPSWPGPQCFICKNMNPMFITFRNNGDYLLICSQCLYIRPHRLSIFTFTSEVQEFINHSYEEIENGKN